MDKEDQLLATAFGKRIKQLRLERGYSVVELSKRSKVSETQIRNIEAGKCVTTVLTISKLSKGLGIRIKDIFDERYKKLKEEK